MSFSATCKAVKRGGSYGTAEAVPFVQIFSSCKYGKDVFAI